ncbi:UNKNOWN [Stylonychia lemnae]|uniref:Dickkopf N-terminal cysteine-rich domain-containing protein n=1 Tax=Stylonychia lemnae TaxID=5949 RepID=A0A077ZQ65_STYLE|nr:UNKNOWN [Stylonychia lemnae]|eukprot:CDW72072.1 UNKNOWN [Stylonychia lemnae]
MLLSRVMYKIKNQQRNTLSFKHIQGVKRLSSKFLKEGKNMPKDELFELINKIRSEAQKAGQYIHGNLKLNFFANYSAILQGLLSRIDIIFDKILNIQNKLEGKVEPKKQQPVEKIKSTNQPIKKKSNCPILECTDKSRDDKLCFIHSGTNPVTTVKFYPCNEGFVCDLDYNRDELAWVNSTQQFTQSSTDPNLSAVYQKKTQAYCVSLEKFKYNLLAGRQCLHNSQCYQRNCYFGICRGKSSGEECANHQECDIGLTCRHQMEWPYNTLCLPFKLPGEECDHDFDCEMNYKCWYPSETHSKNKTKTCMTAYSLADGASIGYRQIHNENLKHQNFLENGKVCKSMFAVPTGTYSGKCASYNSADSNACSPFVTQTNKVSLSTCKYNYNQNSATETVKCDCSMKGSNLGMCTWASKETHILYAQKMSYLLTQMDYCHSADRENLIAFGECGSRGTKNTDWQEAVRAKLEIETYAQRKGDSQITCIDAYHPNSLSNYIRSYYSFDQVTAILYAGANILRKGFEIVILTGLFYYFY